MFHLVIIAKCVITYILPVTELCGLASSIRSMEAALMRNNVVNI